VLIDEAQSSRRGGADKRSDLQCTISESGTISRFLLNVLHHRHAAIVSISEMACCSFCGICRARSCLQSFVSTGIQDAPPDAHAITFRA
jgi:hypothetical protein